MTNNPTEQGIEQILDTYYAPIKLPDNNRKELVAALTTLIEEAENRGYHKAVNDYKRSDEKL